MAPPDHRWGVSVGVKTAISVQYPSYAPFLTAPLMYEPLVRLVPSIRPFPPLELFGSPKITPLIIRLVQPEPDSACGLDPSPILLCFEGDLSETAASHASQTRALHPPDDASEFQKAEPLTDCLFFSF